MNKKEVVNQRERKVTCMVFLMNACFISVWSGYAIINIMGIFGYEVTATALAVSLLLAKAGGCLNPVVFVFMNTQVRYIFYFTHTLDCITIMHEMQF